MSRRGNTRKCPGKDRHPADRRGAALLWIAVAAFASLSPLLTPAARAAGAPLKVVGRFLQDANGNNVMMRGVNVPVYKSGWADDLVAVAAAIAKTKANVVRLEWWAVPPAGTTQYTVANLDRAIREYADLGILPIVELHDLTFQYGHDAKPPAANSDGNDQALFANTITSFWTRADVRSILVKHENHLAINLANEWGSSTYGDGTSTAANFVQNYANAFTAMRNAGINTPLIVDAPKGFEYQFVLDHGQQILDADPQRNAMLSVHAYWAASEMGDAQVSAVLHAIRDSGLPVILGEASSNAWTTVPCDPVHYANLLSTANADQIGYLLWAWYEDGQCGQKMNITVNADGVTVPSAASPGFGYDAIRGAGYGIDTALPATSRVATAPPPVSAVLTPGRAIATWPADVPPGEKRPVLVFLPGWGGTGAVNAAVDGLNTILVNKGYVTLAIGFDSNAKWISDIDVKTREGLDKLCADAGIPADCNAVALVGESYGAAQNYWVIEHLRANGYDGGAGAKGRALAFLSQDAGYAPPGTVNDWNTGAFTRTGLADTASYGVAMIENLGDATFPVDACTWGNCGARTLSRAHYARKDPNVFSVCPAGGGHGTRGYVLWNPWVVSALKTLIHVKGGVPAFTGYTAPALGVSNACGVPPRTLRAPSSATQDGWVLESSETSSRGGTLDAGATTLRVGDNGANRQYRAIVSFNTAAIPDNATIESAKLKVRYQGRVGTNPFATHGNILVDAMRGAFSNSAALQTGDFEGTPSRAAAGTIRNAPVSGWYSASIPAGYVNKTGLTQLRLRFTKDDNNDRGADYLLFSSGNAASVYRPVLEVVYSVP